MSESDQCANSVDKRGQWSSRLMFILAAAGSAIGLGNIWRFPYLVGKFGGGAFVLTYLVFIVLAGLPILVAEIMIGREAHKNPVGAFSQLSNKNPFWTLVGFLGVAAGFVILSYYSVVAGWTLDYFTKSVAGTYMHADVETINALFGSLVGDGIEQTVWHTAFMGATIAIVIFGIKEGLEYWIGILMPVLFVLLLVMVGYGLFKGEARETFAYLFVPNWHDLVTNEAGEFTVRPILAAMGQAFFTLSLGMGAMITYGSYLGGKERLPSSAGWIIFLDTMVAILAGMAIYTILFQYNLDPAAGPGLVFKVLPLAFGQMPGGRIIGIVFFALLAFAALTSAISLLEVVVAHFIDDRGWSRRKATLIMGGVIWFLGLFSALSFNVLSHVTLLKDMEGQGMSIFDSVDTIANNYMLPIGGFFIALYAGWFMARDRVAGQLEGVSPLFIKGWNFLVKFVAPAFVAVLLAFTVSDYLRSGTGDSVCDAARSGDLERLKVLVEAKPELANDTAEKGMSALHFTIRYGHTPCAIYLLEKGAEPGAKNESGVTPLMIAATNDGNVDLAVALIQDGADVNDKDSAGNTALHKAAGEGAALMVKTLIGKGANVNAQNNDGNTPLHLAAAHGFLSASRALLEAGADPKIKNNEGQTVADLPKLKAHSKVRELIDGAK